MSSYDFFRFTVFQIPSPYFWDYTTLNFDSDVTIVDSNFSSVFNSTIPDLSEFKRRDGKLIMYHGYADPLIPPANTINYYNSVASAQPSYRLTRSVASAIVETQGFFRLFLVPGMYHCVGGPGANIFNGVANQGNPTDPVHDILSALDSWVADHEAPEEIIASNQRNGVVNFTRSGGFQLSPAGQAELANNIAPKLKGLQNAKVVVYGFTDNTPVGPELQRQGIPDNLVLSTRRATTVVTFLVQLGVNPRIISAKGVGDTRPVASNDTPEGRAQNRRMEITIQGPGAPGA